MGLYRRDVIEKMAARLIDVAASKKDATRHELIAAFAIATRDVFPSRLERLQMEAFSVRELDHHDRGHT